MYLLLMDYNILQLLDHDVLVIICVPGAVHWDTYICRAVHDSQVSGEGPTHKLQGSDGITSF